MRMTSIGHRVHLCIYLRAPIARCFESAGHSRAISLDELQTHYSNRTYRSRSQCENIISNSDYSTVTSMSLVRQNFHEECEEQLNRQINTELYASYVYLSMAYYFDRSDVALPGLHKYFKKASDEEREHAMKLMSYQNKRGGNVMLTVIDAPAKYDWGSAKDAMMEALELEKRVNKCLLDLHTLAGSHNDANFLDFLETEFLQEQVDSIKEIADRITQLELVGENLGVFIFDKELQE